MTILKMKIRKNLTTMENTHLENTHLKNEILKADTSAKLNSENCQRWLTAVVLPKVFNVLFAFQKKGP